MFDCTPVRVVAKDGVVEPIVTLSPAELACMAGELDLATWLINEGEARLKLLIDGEFLGPGKPIAELAVTEGLCLKPGEHKVADGL